MAEQNSTADEGYFFALEMSPEANITYAAYNISDDSWSDETFTPSWVSLDIFPTLELAQQAVPIWAQKFPTRQFRIGRKKGIFQNKYL